ncbi:hypothetical protein [Streptomyces sp. NPDC057702]|uniref:hypothetical protein n=1 Tax=unclassified Streptomyces TaxID=2593676 RepID=UPI003696919A
MKIVIEDVPEEFARELVQLAAGRGLHMEVAPPVPQWTGDYAQILLRALPDLQRNIFQVTVEGDGWGDAAKLRGDDGASLKGRTGSITRTINALIKRQELPPGLPKPIAANNDPNKRSYQRTGGFRMPQECLPAFREAFKSIREVHQ